MGGSDSCGGLLDFQALRSTSCRRLKGDKGIFPRSVLGMTSLRISSHLSRAVSSTQLDESAGQLKENIENPWENHQKTASAVTKADPARTEK